MTWLKNDDGEWLEPWVVMVGNEAYGIYQRLAGYCAQYLTDGLVPAEIVAMICSTTSGKKMLPELERVGRVERLESGSVFLPCFLDHNPSKVQAEADKEARAAKAKKAANARWNGALRRA